MDKAISPGDSCIIQRDIKIQGEVAYFKGERVKIEAISPNPDIPEFSYLVFSHRLETNLQLRARDIRPIEHTHSEQRNENCTSFGYPLNAKGECERCGDDLVSPPRTVPQQTRKDVSEVDASAAKSYRPFSYAIGIIEIIVGLLYLVTTMIAVISLSDANAPDWVYLIGLLVIGCSVAMILGGAYAFTRIGEYHVMHTVLGSIVILLSVLTINITWTKGNSSGWFSLGSSSWWIKAPLFLSGLAIIILSRVVVNRYRASLARDGKKYIGLDRCPSCGKRVKVGAGWCSNCGARFP